MKKQAIRGLIWVIAITGLLALCLVGYHYGKIIIEDGRWGNGVGLIIVTCVTTVIGIIHFPKLVLTINQITDELTD